jgi:hypothetical protein
MAFEHRGFRVTLDVVPDETDIHWQCKVVIEGLDEETGHAGLPSVELTIPRLKIDVLMVLSMVEHRAVTSIDDWCAQQLAAA